MVTCAELTEMQPLSFDSSPAFQRLDGRGDLLQVIVELMIAVGQATDARLRYRARVQLNM